MTPRHKYSLLPVNTRIFAVCWKVFRWYFPCSTVQPVHPCKASVWSRHLGLHEDDDDIVVMIFIIIIAVTTIIYTIITSFIGQQMSRVWALTTSMKTEPRQAMVIRKSIFPLIINIIIRKILIKKIMIDDINDD